MFPARWAKSPKKQSIRVYFNNMALCFECQIIKNAPLQTVFWRFCPLSASYLLIRLKLFLLSNK